MFLKLRCLMSGPCQIRRKIKDLGFFQKLCLPSWGGHGTRPLHLAWDRLQRPGGRFPAAPPTRPEEGALKHTREASAGAAVSQFIDTDSFARMSKLIPPQKGNPQADKAGPLEEGAVALSRGCGDGASFPTDQPLRPPQYQPHLQYKHRFMIINIKSV